MGLSTFGTEGAVEQFCKIYTCNMLNVTLKRCNIIIVNMGNKNKRIEISLSGKIHSFLQDVNYCLLILFFL